MQKVIVVQSTNILPNVELDQKLGSLQEEGFRITSATTTMTLLGKTDEGCEMLNIPPGGALHIYYATTVVLEK